MDVKYVIQRGKDSIAGFKQTDAGKPRKIWCAECAIEDSETIPFIAEETDLQLPDVRDIKGTINPIIYEFLDTHTGETTKQDLADIHCDECGQTLKPK